MASAQPTPKLLGIHDDEPEDAIGSSGSSGPGLGGGLLGGIGIVFLAVGLTDLLLGWVPLSFGQPEWEFGTVTATLDGLPVFVLGTALVLADASRRGARRTVRILSVACLLFAAALVAMVVLYATVVPLALQSVPEGGVRFGLVKAMSKTAVQAVLYPVLFGWLGVRAWRFASRT